jgi:hypothetical protein
VRSIGKLLRFAAGLALLLIVAGCGGIQASKSVSPIDFILPGLLQADPPPADSPDRAVPAAATATLVAQN